MKNLHILLMIIVSLSVLSQSEVITDNGMNYSIFLPDNWVKDEISPTQHCFYDSTLTYKGYLGIVRTDFSSQLSYETQDEWARANFIAYLITTQNSMTAMGIPLTDPFGTILYYDSTTIKHNDSLWAGEIFSTFFSTDTSIGSWSEFIRYTAKGSSGYELYVIGDTADIKMNLGIYATIIEGIVLHSEPVSIKSHHQKTHLGKNLLPSFTPSDLLGRRAMFQKSILVNAPGLYVTPTRKSIVCK